MAFDLSPRPKGFNAPAARQSFDDTARLLLGQAEAVCRHLLPRGRVVSGEWTVGDVDGNGGDSLKVNLREGVWKDFASDEGGADLIALWAAVRGVKMKEAKEEAEAWLGVDAGMPGGARQVGIGVKSTRTPSPASTPNQAPSPAGKPDHVWTYYDADGVVFVEVHRWDARDGRKKEVRPWNPTTRTAKMPDGLRPLYNLPAILKAPKGAVIVLVEGEKCCDAIAAVNDPRWIPTTCLNGSSSSEQTDWSPLNDKTVVRWADNDEAGRKWLASTGAALQHVSRGYDVAIPRDKPPKWDAADATVDERWTLIDAALKSRPAFVKARTIDQTGIGGIRARVPVIPHRWLVNRMFPAGRGGFIAAPGESGKGMLMLDLAVKVATRRDGIDLEPLVAFGNEVVRHGAVAILSAEDDEEEVVRRLDKLYPTLPPGVAERLFFFSYPDAQGRQPLILKGEVGDVAETPELDRVREELSRIPDLALVIVDPISAFVNVDIASNTAAQIVANTIDRLAKSLDATTIGVHHFTKGDRRMPIKGANDARHAIAGGAQLLNGVRFAYSIWPVEEVDATRILKKLGMSHRESAIFRGQMVKSNAPCDREKHWWVRNTTTGLLEIESSLREVSAETVERALVDVLAADILRNNKHYQPVAKTHILSSGGNGTKLMNLMSRRWREATNSERAAALDAAHTEKLIAPVPDSRGLLCRVGDEYGDPYWLGESRPGGVPANYRREGGAILPDEPDDDQ